MVNIQDCGCPCEDNGKKKQIEERALSSINKIYTTEGATYYPDGTGMVTLPLPTAEQMQAIASVPDMASDIKQLKISDAEHTEAIATIESNIDTHAREILQLTNSDDKQNTEIKGITESLISDVDAVFNNTTRDLRISIEREKASAIEAVVNIPATSQTGTYAPSAPITINADNQIGLAHDASLVVKNGQLSVNTQGSVKVDGETIIKDADDVLEVNTAKIAPITYVDSKIKTATAATGKAFGNMAIAADASGVDITMTGIDEATSVTGRIPVCTEDKAGLMTPADRIKIDGIKGDAYVFINTGSFTPSTTPTYNSSSITPRRIKTGTDPFKTVSFDIPEGRCTASVLNCTWSDGDPYSGYTRYSESDLKKLVLSCISFKGLPSSGILTLKAFFCCTLNPVIISYIFIPDDAYRFPGSFVTIQIDLATKSVSFNSSFICTAEDNTAGAKVFGYPVIQTIQFFNTAE